MPEEVCTGTWVDARFWTEGPNPNVSFCDHTLRSCNSMWVSRWNICSRPSKQLRRQQVCTLLHERTMFHLQCCIRVWCLSPPLHLHIIMSPPSHVLYSTCRCTSACSRTDKTIAQILRTGRRTTRNPPSSTERASLLQRGSSCLRALYCACLLKGWWVVNKSPLPWAPGWAWGIGGLGSWSCRLPVFRNKKASRSSFQRQTPIQACRPPDVPLVISRVAIVLGGTCGESPTIRDHACGWWGSRAFLMRGPPGD